MEDGPTPVCGVWDLQKNSNVRHRYMEQAIEIRNDGAGSYPDQKQR